MSEMKHHIKKIRRILLLITAFVFVKDTVADDLELGGFEVTVGEGEGSLPDWEGSTEIPEENLGDVEKEYPSFSVMEPEEPSGEESWFEDTWSENGSQETIQETIQEPEISSGSSFPEPVSGNESQIGDIEEEIMQGEDESTVNLITETDKQEEDLSGKRPVKRSSYRKMIPVAYIPAAKRRVSVEETESEPSQIEKLQVLHLKEFCKGGRYPGWRIGTEGSVHVLSFRINGKEQLWTEKEDAVLSDSMTSEPQNTVELLFLAEERGKIRTEFVLYDSLDE